MRFAHPFGTSGATNGAAYGCRAVCGMKQAFSGGHPPAMLDKGKLSAAVDLQARTYRLLRWLDGAASKGFITPAKAHAYAGLPTDAVVDWLGVHYHNLPADCRPKSRSPEDLRAFSVMLSTYLQISFDFDEVPGPELKSECGCFCPLCTYVAKGPHLKTRKPTPADRKKALRLSMNCLMQMALESGHSLSEERARKLATRPELREVVAWVTYGGQLLRRAEGHAEGPAVLVLWRQFAWSRRRPYRKESLLNVSDILEAERLLVRHIKGGQAP